MAFYLLRLENIEHLSKVEFVPLDLESTDERQIVDLHGLLGGNWLVLGHYRYRKAMPPLESQWNKGRLTLAFLLSGLQHFDCDGQMKVLRGGQGIRLVPGSVFGSGGRPEQRGELVWMIFAVDRRRRFSLPGMSLEASAQWLERMLEPAEDPRFALSPKALANLRRLAWGPPPNPTPLEMTRLSMQCTRTLLAIHDSVDQPLDRHTSQGVKRVLAWMEDNLGDAEISAEGLAHIAGLSVSRLQDCFRDEIGLTPADYFLRRRIASAQQELTKGKAVTDVAMEFGFSSSQYFATAFKRYNRMSPTEWLANHAQSHLRSPDVARPDSSPDRTPGKNE